MQAFHEKALQKGRELYRDLPWRRTCDPYAIWISEVMLQQTQVSRVDGRWQHWLERFPSVEALAAARSADVLDEWQGLGYNRRALMLWRAAGVLDGRGGTVPQDEKELLALPGVGPATAAGIRAFAFNLPGVYLETNVRSVFIHEFFPTGQKVGDAQLIPLVRACCPPNAADPADCPRSWYYALLDWGAYLKATLPNPSRRSASHVRQSRFEGSHRQKRAALVRLMLEHSARGETVVTLAGLSRQLSRQELEAGREALSNAQVKDLLVELEGEGFCHEVPGGWML